MTLPGTNFELAQLSIKSIHAMVIHFPIAFAYCVPLAYLFHIKKQSSDSRLIAQLSVFLTWSASLLAVLAGHLTAHLKNLHFQDPNWSAQFSDLSQAISIHRLLGFSTLITYSTLALIVWTEPSFIRKPSERKFSFFILFISILALILLSLTAHIGSGIEI